MTLQNAHFCKWRIDEFPHLKQVNHDFYCSNLFYLKNCEIVFEWFKKNMDQFLSIDKVSPSLSKKGGKIEIIIINK
jgi:hypothetical protein